MTHTPMVITAMATLVLSLLLLAMPFPTAVAAMTGGTNCSAITCGGKVYGNSYPFAIGSVCSLPGFGLTCAPDKYNFSSLFLGNTSIRVLDKFGPDYPYPATLISIGYFVKMTPGVRNYSVHWEAPGRPFAISGSSNMSLFIVGCGVKASLFGYSGVEVGNCSVACLEDQKMDMLPQRLCVGIGCCRIDITVNLRAFTLNISPTGKLGWLLEQVNAFVTYHDGYRFRASGLKFDLSDAYDAELSWAIPYQPNCKRAMSERGNYACVSDYSRCLDSPIGGYVCKCSEGFIGNPYILNGCVANANGQDAAVGATQGNCTVGCGDNNISYPFGIGPECSLPGFSLNCEPGEDNRSKLLLGNSSTTVTGFALSFVNYYPVILTSIGYFVKMTPDVRDYSVHSWEAPGSPFAISGSSNISLFIVGCGIKASLFIGGSGVEVGNCSVVCIEDQIMDRLPQGSCVGIGCCFIDITVNLRAFTLNISRFVGKSAQLLEQVSAFITNKDLYLFDTSDLGLDLTGDEYHGTELSWAIPYQPNCKRAMKDRSNYACISNHSECLDSSIGGYVCNCTEGFIGNPYILNGCVEDNWQGMTFDSIEDVQNFYKDYARDVGFSIRIGQQRKGNEEITAKYFYCSREGYRKERKTQVVDQTEKKRKTHSVLETRCGCEAHIYVKLGSDKKYRIASMVEHHNHGLVSPNKRHLLRSNRNVNETAKSTLFNCHKASIGTSQAYRLLHVSAGGFQNVGCTLRDLKNYYRDLRYRIKDADAQMFVAQLERKKEVNSAFFYDFEVDAQGRLMRMFWADATSRKNYKHFGDVVSLDSTYTTNQYNMIFVPITGVNHHLQSVFLGAAFLSNEKIESYVWLFETFLKAMGGVPPHLIITDEDASMKAAISKILPDTTHRLCMWHIMDKVPEKVSPSLREDREFLDRLNSCVWGSETPEEFESSWSSFINDFQLTGNEWFTTRYLIRASWIPAYFMDIPLAGVLRTTSRSESANSFFNRFIRRKLSLVEFWLRFDTALECQRQEELIADNKSFHSEPKLKTLWAMEKQCSTIYTHEVFAEFQSQVLAARDHCFIQGITDNEETKSVTVTSHSGKERVVTLDKSTTFWRCSCKFEESYGIPCRHIIQAFRTEKQDEIPWIYIMKRWEKRCKREIFFDEEGNILDEKPIDPVELSMKKKISDSRNKFEDLLQMAKQSEQGLDFLFSSLCNLHDPLQKIVPHASTSKQDEFEAFIGTKIPNEVDIHLPNDIKSKRRCKRIKKNKEMKQGHNKRTCGICKQLGHHDARTCPNKVISNA